MSVLEVMRGLSLSAEVVEQLGALWGKSAAKAGGDMNLLLSHLLDTAAVAELMWDRYLAPRTKGVLEEVSGGRGRMLFVWLCAVHDCGKATPAFQEFDAAGAARTRASGLAWRSAALKSRRWRHDKAGGRLLIDVLGREWRREQIGWVWPLIAGHHGAFPSAGVLSDRAVPREHQGRGAEWGGVQRALVEVVTRCVGFGSVADVCPRLVPSRAEQLELSGLIVMADWIASDSRYFLGIDRIERVGLEVSRSRACAGWEALRLRGGWGVLPDPDDGDLVKARFGQKGRSSQDQLVAFAREVPVSPLCIVEGPMGEGKTKAALVAAEVLAARFGADGVFVGMPTQATSDPMYSQVRKWLKEFGGDLESQVALLHGKRMFNPEWREASTPGSSEECCSDGSSFDGIDEEDELYGIASRQAERYGPIEWFLGRKRGLLCSFAVGTIDQLLFAATRTRHVMLRFAGLAGKVVIIDEVHAADVYMQQFLVEALRWLGQARVPVVLLSATLPPSQRRALVEAYVSGQVGAVDPVVLEVPEPTGYPSITGAYVRDGQAEFVCRSTTSWREAYPVALEWLPDVSDGGGLVAERTAREVAGGGVALVVLNTVERAQGAFRVLDAMYPGEVHLLHGRLCTAHRADRTAACLSRLGPAAGAARPKRMIVVATQLAEQSFDIDADILVTDLAPIDLLLQRIGRLHRHEGTVRRPALASPRVLVTGIVPGEGLPVLHGGSEAVYGRFRLLRTAAVVERTLADGGTWSVPSQVPGLVAEVYGERGVCPSEWGEAEEKARAKWEASERDRVAAAEGFLLAGRGEWSRPTLSGLHYGQAGGVGDEKDLEAVVRDGKRSVEVVIVRRCGGGYTALDGAALGVHGEASEHVLDEVLGGTTRLPARLTKAAESELRPLDGWRGHPWLEHTLALVLEEDGTARLGEYEVSYDFRLGLMVKACPAG
ncbi:CRISPR-associated helicase Cas3' [Streptomyces sp. NPDC056549]|uniref:CRISPR-associated helicase Cas3' n=1 Tax=Streptomyces sp. NPDC056549 TaxID=3345864 RepID=UPI0036C77AE4